MPEDIGQDDLLREKTIQVYWYLLTHGTKGIREIQKDLNISSPSSVSYQINKLIKAGVVSKNEETEKYFVDEEIKSGILGFYVRIGYRMIPRFTLYLTIYLIGLIIFFFVIFIQGDQFILNPINLFFFFYLVFGAAVFIFESIKIWKTKPK
ncbi:MAG: winged helix-turn-helix domain-containing protein [Candidatus Hodarchaeota archaeon]